MTRMTGPDCAVMCNFINTHTHTRAVMCNLINTHVHTNTHTRTHTHTQTNRGVGGVCVGVVPRVQSKLSRAFPEHVFRVPSSAWGRYFHDERRGQAIPFTDAVVIAHADTFSFSLTLQKRVGNPFSKGFYRKILANLCKPSHQYQYNSIHTVRGEMCRNV